MRGFRAKRLRILSNHFEPKRHKHGAVLYSIDHRTGQIFATGNRRVYKVLKSAYKTLGMAPINDAVQRGGGADAQG